MSRVRTPQVRDILSTGVTYYAMAQQKISEFFMMTSSNGNIFRVTGPLCGEFTGLRWIPLTKASDAGLWCFLWSLPWINSWVNNQEAGDLRHFYANYDVIVMCPRLLRWRGTNHRRPRPLGNRARRQGWLYMSHQVEVIRNKKWLKTNSVNVKAKLHRACKKVSQYAGRHYNDVIIGTIASQITSLTIVYSNVYSGADQRKHQSSASLAFVSNAENVSIWWRHHKFSPPNLCYPYAISW